jgi:type IV pilus assembly protein PilX
MAIMSKTNHRKQGGFVLIASMLMLIVLTFMAVGLYHNMTSQENMSSNTKEKGRAFQMAQSTLQYAEYQLLTNGLNTVPTGSCAAPPTGNAFTICANTGPNLVGPSSSASVMSITNGMTYNPTTDDSNVKFSETGGIGTYYAEPEYFVEYLGQSPVYTCAKLYQITALAYGGTGGTAAAVQSTYQLTPSVCNVQG